MDELKQIEREMSADLKGIADNFTHGLYSRETVDRITGEAMATNKWLKKVQVLIAKREEVEESDDD